jgi:hypothetical protein
MHFLDERKIDDTHIRMGMTRDRHYCALPWKFSCAYLMPRTKLIAAMTKIRGTTTRRNLELSWQGVDSAEGSISRWSCELCTPIKIIRIVNTEEAVNLRFEYVG